MSNNKFYNEEIQKLKKEKNATILAHNYQIPEVQEAADFVGDSLGLSQMAAKTKSDLIIFCGVHFMAETASIISPQKKIILPDPEAGCSLASSITLKELLEWKEKFPDAVVVSYVNTTAEIKSETDYCCTSSNAVKVVNAIPADKTILFLPDRFLGMYVQAITGREMEIWQGACHVHEKIGEFQLSEKQKEYPNAEVLIHPECGCSTSCMAQTTLSDGCKDINFYSTEGMFNRVAESESKTFIIATEVGMLHRLKKFNPEKTFYPANENSICEYMKMITLEKLYTALKNEEKVIKVEEGLAKKAKLPITRMLEIV